MKHLNGGSPASPGRSNQPNSEQRLLRSSGRLWFFVHAKDAIRLARALALGTVLASLVSIPAAEAVRRVGTPGNDVLLGTNEDDALFGEAGDDQLFGLGGNDRLEGGPDDDRLYGGAGADVLNGGPGIDLLSYFDSNAGVTVDLATGAASGGHAHGDTFSGIEWLDGSPYDDHLTGDDRDNRFWESSGNDLLEGGEGNDQFWSGADADRIHGGAGRDHLSYYASDAAVAVNLATGAASGGYAEGDTFTSIESVYGTRFADRLTGDDGNNNLFGGAGADVLEGGAGLDFLGYHESDAAVTVNLATGAASGGHATGDTFSGFERLLGSPYNDHLTGDEGDNFLVGGAGADVLVGGPGADFLGYFPSDAGVTVNLATGAASGGHATGDTFTGFERIEGSRYADNLTGDDGQNWFNGAAGNDRLVGGEGNDQFWPGAGADIVQGGPGRDHLSYFNSDAGITVNLATGVASGGYAQGDTITSIESIAGTRYADRTTGDDGNNYLYGTYGADVLDGGEGDDLLTYFHSDAAVTVNLATGAASGGRATGDTFSGIEWLGGSPYNDRLTGDDGDNVLVGYAGADVLDGGQGSDVLSYTGSDAAVTVNLATGGASGGHAEGDSFTSIERVAGSRYDDRLTGDDGDNVFRGGAGADVLDGGAGTDGFTYTYSDAGVTVNLATRTASGGNAEGDTFTGFENLKGSSHADRLTGDDGDNELEGVGGNDHMVGGGGSDTFIFEPENGHDVIGDFTNGMDRIDLTAFDLPNGFDDVEAAAYGRAHIVALFPAASDTLGRQGFARVINHSDEEGTVHIHAYDDSGTPYGPLSLTIEAGETVHFNSDDLEQGNPDKGLEGATGEGKGQWRLELASALDIEVLSYVRTEDGFLTSMHDLVPQTASVHRVATFNPGKNVNQMSRLRLINPGDETAEVRIAGIDGQGEEPGSVVTLSLAAGESRTLDASELETGDAEGLDGALGTGSGKWQLHVSSEQPLQVLSLLSSPTGHLTNLSTAPDNSEPGDDDTTSHRIPLFPAAASWAREGVQGFARIINHSHEAGTIDIRAFDDEGVEHGPVSLGIEAGETVHFNSLDLESGNPDKDLSEGTGAGTGDWRLELRSRLALEVLAYIRTQDGFLTSMHDLVPETADGHRVVIFNPGRNVNQVSWLRIVNPGEQQAEVRIEGIDGKGFSGASSVLVTVAPGAALTLTSQELESGNAEGVIGALGTGSGKWHLTASSEQPVRVMSLLSSPTGHLTNLSTTGSGEMPALAMSGVRIDLSAHGGGTILLRNFDIEELDDSDFLFQSASQQRGFALPALHVFEIEDHGASGSWESGAAGDESAMH